MNNGFSNKTILFIGVVVFVAALLVRNYQLNYVQPHHDEYPMFGFNIKNPPEWNGDIGEFASVICRNAIGISESDSTPVGCIVAECFRLTFGENLCAARHFHQIIQSLGVALVAGLAGILFSFSFPAVLAVSLSGIFGGVSIIFGQFGEMYALYFFASCIQAWAYWRFLHNNWSWNSYLSFIVVAIICGYFEYLQAWVTLGLLIASCLEIAEISRCRRGLRFLGAGAIYLVLMLPLLCELLSRASLTMGFRPYLWAYYPRFPQETGTLSAWVWYLLRGGYDFLNYHLGLVYDSAIYRPLEWNWYFSPMLIVILVGIPRLLFWTSGRKKFPLSISPIIVFSCVLLSNIIANIVGVMPLGGVRNTICLAPFVWFFYGAAIVGVGLLFGKWGKQISLICALFPLLLFVRSAPGLFSDRLSRVDFQALGSILERVQPDTVVLPQASYYPFLQLLQNQPEFFQTYFGEGKAQLISLDEMEDANWQNYPLPIPGKNIVAVDLNISSEGAKEGRGITNDHPTLQNMAGANWEIIPLLEISGPHIGVNYHQSIYYPPNSFYVYQLVRRISR